MYRIIIAGFIQVQYMSASHHGAKHGYLSDPNRFRLRYLENVSCGVSGRVVRVYDEGLFQEYGQKHDLEHCGVDTFKGPDVNHAWMQL